MMITKFYIAVMDLYRFDREHCVIGRNEHVRTTVINPLTFVKHSINRVSRAAANA